MWVCVSLADCTLSQQDYEFEKKFKSKQKTPERLCALEQNPCKYASGPTFSVWLREKNTNSAARARSD